MQAELLVQMGKVGSAVPPASHHPAQPLAVQAAGLVPRAGSIPGFAVPQAEQS